MAGKKTWFKVLKTHVPEWSSKLRNDSKYHYLRECCYYGNDSVAVLRRIESGESCHVTSLKTGFHIRFCEDFSVEVI